MSHSKKHRSPLIAGFMAVSLAFYSPAGHDALYEALLRVKFAPHWLQASFNTKSFMSFSTFREQAAIWAYDPNPRVHLNNVRLLQDTSSFCLPLPDDGKAPENPENIFTACHAAATRDDKKEKKNLARLKL